MTDTTPILSLPLIQAAQAQKHVTHNEAMLQLERLVQLSVLSDSQATPPVTPANGDRYIVGPSATGDWAGQEGTLAVHDVNTWIFVTPQEGWQAYVTDAGLTKVYASGAWAAIPPETQNTDGLGIQTSWDSTNRLAVSSEATLLNHAGDGHQLKINKAEASDTASLLYQTNFSGRAEIGTTGNDDFAIKTSPDGSAWTTALSLDASNSMANFAGTVVSQGDLIGDRFMSAADSYPYLVCSLNNNHAAPQSVSLEFGFSSQRRFAFGANDNGGFFFVTAYASDGAWRGSPLTIEYAQGTNMGNALYVASDRKVGVGKVPGAHLDVDGELRLKTFAKAALPAAGAGTLAYVSDATGGAGLAYSDGTDWRMVRDDALA